MQRVWSWYFMDLKFLRGDGRLRAAEISCKLTDNILEKVAV